MGNENVPLNYYFFFLSRDAIDMDGLDSAYDCILELFDRVEKVRDEISAIERDGNFADQQCSVSYALAYLKVHYDVKPDVSVEIYDL